ncbi:MAG: alkaline phosphatase D family protein, partial [Candidatus Methylomirabilales bacterium]
ANISARKHPRFLEMARGIPCCAVWDDHDFRKNDSDSTNFAAKGESLAGFLDYWGNNLLVQPGANFGLTTLITYGNVDIYLMDGRFVRDKDSGDCFTQAQVKQIVATITQRGTTTDRLVILASGSTWNHTQTESIGPFGLIPGGEAYGNSKYEAERELFYNELNGLVGNQIKGLVFLSGDIHINEIYEIVLASGSGGSNKVAPEFVSSPLGDNSSLKKAQPIEGERKWSVPSEGTNARRGFATLDIDTTSAVPEGRWTIQVNYHDANASVTTPYASKEYTLSSGQFVF